jgi:hypothetical protein
LKEKELIHETIYYFSFLPQIEEGAAIGRLLDQCMSYGASLARVGVDVRGTYSNSILVVRRR